MSIFEELAEVQVNRKDGCATCNWLNTLTPEEQADWDKVMAMPKTVYNDRAVAQITTKHGAKLTLMMVTGHRYQGHRR